MFEKNERLWQERFEQLKKYKEKYGHCKVPITCEENPSLAKWVSRQREKEQKLTSEQRQLLDDLGFLWRKDIQQLKEQQWLSQYEQLKAHYEDHGHVRIPESSTTHRSLSLWIRRQRKMERKLSDEKKQLLNALNFPWNRKLKKQQKERWMKWYEQLKDYYNEHGNSRVPSKNKEDAALHRLGGFVTRMRRDKEKLESWQLKLLEEVEFAWSAGLEKEGRRKWIQMLNRLRSFKRDRGLCDVPSKYEADRELGRWVEVQRWQFEYLAFWKQQKLMEVGFKTSEMLRKEQWKEWLAMYQRLKAFREKYGHTEVPELWKEDKELARWVVNQRWAKNPPKEKVLMLRSLGFKYKGEIDTSKRERDEHGKYISKLKK